MTHMTQIMLGFTVFTTLCACTEDVAPPSQCTQSEDPPTWLALGTITLDEQGSSSELTLDVPSDVRAVTLRVTAHTSTAQPPQCYRIEDVRLGDTMLVGQAEVQRPQLGCTTCEHGTWVGLDGAWATFPNTQAPFPLPNTLRWRIQARDCSLGIARSAAGETLDVEIVMLNGDDEREEVTVPLVIVAWDEGMQRELNKPGALDAIKARAQELLEPAHLTLDLTASWSSEDGLKSPSSLDHDALIDVSDSAQMKALTRHALDAAKDAIPVVIVPCLKRNDPLDGQHFIDGWATTIPGGQDGGARSVLLISRGQCSLLDPPSELDMSRHGVVLAHELGHHFGLRHTETRLGSMQAPGTPKEARLMSAGVTGVPEEELGLTPTQIRIMRAHAITTILTR